MNNHLLNGFCSQIGLTLIKMNKEKENDYAPSVRERYGSSLESLQSEESKNIFDKLSIINSLDPTLETIIAYEESIANGEILDLCDISNPTQINWELLGDCIFLAKFFDAANMRELRKLKPSYRRDMATRWVCQSCGKKYSPNYGYKQIGSKYCSNKCRDNGNKLSIEYQGKVYGLYELAEKHGVDAMTIKYRLSLGQSIDEAVIKDKKYKQLNIEYNGKTYSAKNFAVKLDVSRGIVENFHKKGMSGTEMWEIIEDRRKKGWKKYARNLPC